MLQTQGQREHPRCWAWEHTVGAPATQAKGQRVGHGATKLLGSLPLICLFLLLLRDL